MSSSSSSIGVNLRVTGHCNQGGRKYMEDVFSVAYQQTEDEKDLEYAFFGIFDGHGGREAALFAKENLMDSITKQKSFWSDDDDSVLRAIREGFLSTQTAMWSDQPNWRRTATGLPSTAGTTASVCFIKRGKIFIGHCGDSGIVLGERDPENPGRWKARPLTTDHKPESTKELERITESGGKVVYKNGVPRVVWYRPRGQHQGPVRRSTPIDEVPFLAVARALGDLWSYNAKDDVFIVSPEPDLHVYDIDILKDRCLVLATDGAWNVLNPEMTIQHVFDVEMNNEQHMINPTCGTAWMNPSKKLVDLAIDRWTMCKLRADNTSIVTVMLDPPGPPRAQVLRRLHGVQPPSAAAAEAGSPPALPPRPHQSGKGVAIISRFPNSDKEGEKEGVNMVEEEKKESIVTRIVHDSFKEQQQPQKLKVSTSTAQPITNHPRLSYSKYAASSSSGSTPPPLPIKPAQRLQNIKNKLVQTKKPASSPVTRSRNQSGGPQKPATPPPAVPPKQQHQSRRSKAPVPQPDYNSDSENQQQRPATRTSFVRSRVAAVTAAMAANSAAANTAVRSTTTLKSSRRSEPALLRSPRVLRPRNAGTPTPPDDNANTVVVGGGLKRKRRSLEAVSAAALVSTGPGKLCRRSMPAAAVKQQQWAKVNPSTVAAGAKKARILKSK